MNLSPSWRRAGDLALSIGAGLGGLCVVLALAAAIFDVRVLTFRSGSMSPSIETGALALARHVPADDLRVGDVVSVRDSRGDRVTHRVVALDRRGSGASLQLRGDANTVPDAEQYVVPSADRIFFSVPYLGYVAAVIASPIGLFLLGLYVAALLLILFRRSGVARHRGRTPVVLVASALALVATAGSLAVRSSSTQAFWTDAVGTNGSTFSTATVPPPATFTCSPNLTSVTFTWAAVPGATTYFLHYGLGGSVSTPVAGTSRTVATTVIGGEAWVTTDINYGSVIWSSGPSTSRPYTVFGIGLC